MSEIENLEQSLVKFIEAVNEGEQILNNCDESTASNVQDVFVGTLQSMEQATSKLFESVVILREFEALMHDKTASLHMISNEMMLNSLEVHEQEEQLREQQKMVEAISQKLTEMSASFVQCLENPLN